MCMRNVNATVFMCSEIQTVNDKVSSLVGMYDKIAIQQTDDENFYIDNFNIAFNCSIIFDETLVNEPDCLQLGQPYECMIRLTHVDSGLGTSLLSFPIEVTKSQLNTWCKPFYEIKQFAHYLRIYLPKGTGNYAIKVLIKEKNAKRWITQTIHSLRIETAD